MKPTIEYLQIKVEQRHIDSGYACDSNHCALALAVDDAGNYDSVSIFLDSIQIWYFDQDERTSVRERWLHTVEAKRFINAFDAGQAVEPCEFSLPLDQRLTFKD